MEKHNTHECVKYKVQGSFVSSCHQYGYMKEELVHDANSAHEAASKAMINWCNEKEPLSGISVYECVLVY